MGRHYDTAIFGELISTLVSVFPDVAIGLDVIAGFPTETESEFLATLDFISGLDIAYIHAFTFSRRWGTPAWSLPNQISNAEKNRRVNLLTALSAHKKQLYTDKLLQGKVMLRGICESVTDGMATCLSDHFVRAYSASEANPGDIISGLAKEIYGDGVRLETNKS